MNIYFHELKSMRKSAVIWTCVLITVAAMYISMYPSIAKDAADFKALLGNYPAPVRAMLGINLDYVTSFLGFYSMIFSFIILCGAIQAMNLGLSILSKESRERTADFLLVKPVSRGKIVSSKLSAAVTTILLTNIVFYTAVCLLAKIINTGKYDSKLFFLINLTMLLIQLIFLAIGMAVSVFFNNLKTVLPISIGTVFGLYMIGALLATGKSDTLARYLSPFKYFDYIYIIKNGSYEATYLITGGIIIAVSIIVSYIIYIKKDIHAVS